MQEYLLIRPDDSPLFDGGRGARRQFIVLDEAHQYRGARGMEMGMLIRRLKQRLRAGGRQDSFRCIATSATISSGESEEDKQVVAEFAEERFGEPFSAPGIVFGESQQTAADGPPRRYHAFLRALEGWTHPGKVEAPYTVCIASASNLTGLVKSSVECRRTGL